MNLTSIPLEYYLALSSIIFVIGAAGVITRRNAIIIFINLTLVAFSAYLGDSAGQMFVFFVMAVAAAEAAVGLAIVLALFRSRQTVYVDEVNLMKW